MNFRAEYFHQDHLGNNRLTFCDFNNNGRIEISDDPGTQENELEITQETHYYPFGLEHKGNWYATVAPDNNKLYNGKDLNRDFDINLYDYGARWYDPALGRWTSIDPLADHPNQVDKSPYSYAWNNPIRLNDPDGKCPICPFILALKVFGTGFAIGAGADATTQIVTNKVQGKGAFDDYSISSTVISGFAGGLSGGAGGITNASVRAGVNVAIVAGESISKQVVTDNAVTDAVGGNFSTIQGNMENISATQVISDVAMDKIGGNAKVVDGASINTMEKQLDRLTRINNGNSRPSRVQQVQGAQGRLNNANNTNDYVGGTVGNGLQNVSDAARNALSVGGNSQAPILAPQPVAQDNTRVNIVLPINQ